MPSIFAAFSLPLPDISGSYSTTDGRLLYPDGPPPDCGTPVCDDSEKLCEQLRLVDDNNIIKYASYVIYENRNAPMSSTASLEYTADDFDSNLDYTAYMPIVINPDIDCFCPDDNHLPQDLQNNFNVVPPGESVAVAAANCSGSE